MNDLISRQAAIEAVHKSIFDFFDICDDDEELPMTYKDELLLELNKAITTQIKAVVSSQSIEAESQRAYEQGVKDTLDRYDETCRIASYIRAAVGCKTAKECQELIRNGEIQRVKHGRWETVGGGHYAVCTNCRRYWIPIEDKYDYWFCPHCGADMREVKE